MDIREELLEHWKVALTVAVLIAINLLTFSAQEIYLARERETTAGLARQLNESTSREARLVAANDAQSTRISQLESALRSAGRPQGASATTIGVVAVPSPMPVTPIFVPPTPTNTPAATATVAPTATATLAPTATENPSPTPIVAQPSPSPAGNVRFVSTPNGRGVFVRLDCSAQAATAGVWPDGTRVTIVGASPSCPGWLRVSSTSGQLGWVAGQLLSTTQSP